MVRHYLGIDDLTKQEHFEVFKRAELFEDGTESGKDFTGLCGGKVLGFLFLEESTRTLTSMQAAITRLGGGWTGITSKRESGDIKNAGELATKGVLDAARKRPMQYRREQHDVETLDEVLSTMAAMSDIFAIRSHDNLGDIVKVLKVPVIGCGFMGRHAIGGLWAPFSLWKLMKHDLDGANIGLYGAPAFSRVTISLVETLSKLAKINVYQDSVMPDGAISESTIKTGKARITNDRLDNFIGKLDLLMVSEGVFSYKDVAYNKEFARKMKPITAKTMAKAKKTLLLSPVEPGLMLDGRDNIDMSVRYNNDRYYGSGYYLRQAINVNMAMMTYLMGVKVR
ncbi:MAG: hypothetical protein KGH98_03065 [Candidatus Micrarchaeota archaeon]|nr:hypothetical protein [Candidatus Micrarchaeota archaeon]